MQANTRSVDLPRIIESAIDHTADLVGDRPVSVIAEYPAHLPAVEGDTEKLASLIACFITATISLMQRGEIKIRAELLPADEAPEPSGTPIIEPPDLKLGGPWAVILISFDGGSLTEKGLTELLEGNADWSAEHVPFQIERCATLIAEYRDRIWFETEKGAQSRLSIALPLVGAQTTDDEANVTQLRRIVETRLPEDDETARTLLLMVEDSELRTILSRDLVAAGHRVVVADRSENVLPLARRQSPELVLLDLVSREPTAFDVAMLLKQDPRTRGTPVMFLTSVDEPSGGVSMGAVNFVVRASDTGALVAQVNALLHSGLSPSARVLVVEPDEAQREITAMMIQSHGYRVMEARAAEEALALAERFEPGLVLVNAKVAEERDYWLLRGLRQLSHNLDIHVVADYISEAEARTAMSRGASGFSETGKLSDLLRRVKDQSKKSE